MKKALGIVIIAVLLIAAGLMLFYYSASEPPHGMIASKVPPTDWGPTPIVVTPSPTKLSPEEQDKLPGGMFERTATEADYVLAGINFFTDEAKDIETSYGQPPSKKSVVIIGVVGYGIIRMSVLFLYLVMV